MSKVLLTVQVFAEVVTEDSSSATVTSYSQVSGFICIFFQLN